MNLKRIPEDGFEGEVALREAAAGEYREIMRLVRDALNKMIGTGPDPWVGVDAFYSDRVVVSQDGRLYAYSYTLDDKNQVQLGQPEEVVIDHKNVSLREAKMCFLEADDSGAGLKYRIRVIKAGLSENRNFYPDIVLREASPMFNGVRVFVKADEEHIKCKGKDFRNLIGRITNPKFIEGKQKDTGEIQADLELLESAGEVTAKLREAYDRGMADDLFGFSIDVDGIGKRRSGRITEATKFKKVHSLDLIIEPGAGGQLIKLIEAINPEEQADMKLRERMIEAVKKANQGSLPNGLNIDNDEALEAAYKEAVMPAEPESKKASAASGVSSEDVDKRLHMIEARSVMRETIAGCNLPDAAKTKLKAQFDGMISFKEADVTSAIADERNYLAKFTESGKPDNLGDQSFIESGEDRSEKVDKMLDAFFDEDNRDVNSFKECYITITGDTKVKGHLRFCDIRRMREALGGHFVEAIDSSTFGNAMGDALHRSLRGYFEKPSKYDGWRDLVDIVPVTDFRNQERTRIGGYGDLPIVAQSGAYGALATPTDDVATYAVVKHGGTESLTIEAIKNDDVAAIRRIPKKLNHAAKRTLMKFVLDFLSTNPNLSDTNPVFSVGAGNLGTVALSDASYGTRRLAMMAHQEPGSNEKMDLEPAHIWVPDQLEQAAYDMFVRNTNLDPAFTQHVRAIIHRVWYWTDPNDWYLSADKNELPPIELGFLDGEEEPELFIQDNPAQGSLFSNDQILYKMRHIYGGTVVNREALDGNIVV